MSDIQAIRERHEAAEKKRPHGFDWPDYDGLFAHMDRATLLSALSAAEARAEAAEARVAKLERIANSIKAQCDTIVFNIEQGAWNEAPEHQQSLKSLAQDFSGAIARTLKGTPDGR